MSGRLWSRRPPRSLALLGWCVFSVLLAAPPMASAQSVAQPAIRAGNYEWHPRFSLSGVYDSNFWRESTGDTSAPVNPAILVLADASVSMKTRRSARWNIRWKPYLTMRQVNSESSADTNSTIDDGFGLSRAGSNLDLVALPYRTFSFGLEKKLSYTEQPATEDLVADGYQRFKMLVGPDVIIRPGGGRSGKILSFKLGYRFDMARSLNELDLSGNRRDRDTQKLVFSGRWRFFPKTSVFVRGSYATVNYARGTDLSATGARITGADLDSKPFRIVGGLKGLFSRRLALTIQGGYLRSNHEAGESYEGPTALLQLDYRIPEVLKLKAAYELKVDDDGFSNFYTLNRSYVSTEVSFPHHLYLIGRVGYDHYIYSRFGAPEWTYTLPDRIEPIIRAKVTAGWRAQPWLKTQVSWELEANRSDYYYCLEPTNCFQDSPIDFAEFTRNVVKLTVVAEY